MPEADLRTKMLAVTLDLLLCPYKATAQFHFPRACICHSYKLQQGPASDDAIMGTYETSWPGRALDQRRAAAVR